MSDSDSAIRDRHRREDENLKYIGMGLARIVDAWDAKGTTEEPPPEYWFAAALAHMLVRVHYR